MPGELREINGKEMEGLIPEGLSEKDRDLLIAFGRNSWPLFVGMFNQTLLCFVGLTTPTILSDEAYIWCYSTEAAAEHKLIFGRYARRLLPGLRSLYPRIKGHCEGGNSYRWLLSLGATFLSEKEFEIV